MVHLLSGGGSAAKTFSEPGWMKMKLRKQGIMRKLFILGGRTKNKDVWDKRPEAIFTSGNALTTGDNWDPEAKQIPISRRSPTFLV